MSFVSTWHPTQSGFKAGAPFNGCWVGLGAPKAFNQSPTCVLQRCKVKGPVNTVNRLAALCGYVSKLVNLLPGRAGENADLENGGCKPPTTISLSLLHRIEVATPRVWCRVKANRVVPMQPSPKPKTFAGPLPPPTQHVCWPSIPQAGPTSQTHQCAGA